MATLRLGEGTVNEGNDQESKNDDRYSNEAQSTAIWALIAEVKAVQARNEEHVKKLNRPL
jgi:hypothetical protein